METTRTDKYVERLVREWNQHSKIIIAVDFDSTLSYWPTIHNPEDIAKTIELIKNCQQTGCYTVIHTACSKERYSEIIDYCSKNGINVDSINQNPFPLPYGNDGGKIFYNHQLCDRSGLQESMDILEKALYQRRGVIQSLKPLDEIG